MLGRMKFPCIGIIPILLIRPIAMKSLIHSFLFLLFAAVSSAEEDRYLNLLDAPREAASYNWTPDHMHVGVRWQPSGRPQHTAYDATRPVIATDSSYAQIWVSWSAMEPLEKNCDYEKHPSGQLKAIEQAVDLCNERGMKVEFVFFHAPGWATVNGEKGGHKPKDGLYPQFIERIARYFKGRVHAYQLSHEANLQGLMQDADMDFMINEILLGGALAVQKVYQEEPATPVIISTTGCSPCETCQTREGLDGLGAYAVDQFYDQLIAKKELMQVVDALNMNVSDFGNGFGNMDGSYIPNVWSNYDMARRKLDAAGYIGKKILSAESWITWDDGAPAQDVTGDGNKTEQDAYVKAVTIMGQCIGRGLNTANLPWSDNSSSWAMGLTKVRDYNGRVKELHPDYVTPANDGGADIVTRKLKIMGGDSNFKIEDGSGDVFTIEDYVNPGDPNHLHYYIWRWYAQIAGGSDEVIRHALAGEIGNDIKVTGIGYTGAEQYRLSSYNRTKKRFTVLIYSNGANRKWAKLVIPATIQTGKYYNNDHSRTDFRGEGFADGDTYYARIVTHGISMDDGSAVKPAIMTTPDAVVENGELKITIPQLDRFTMVEFIKR